VQFVGTTHCTQLRNTDVEERIGTKQKWMWTWTHYKWWGKNRFWKRFWCWNRL